MRRIDERSSGLGSTERQRVPADPLAPDALGAAPLPRSAAGLRRLRRALSRSQDALAVYTLERVPSELELGGATALAIVTVLREAHAPVPRAEIPRRIVSRFGYQPAAATMKYTLRALWREGIVSVFSVRSRADLAAVRTGQSEGHACPLCGLWHPCRADAGMLRAMMTRAAWRLRRFLPDDWKGGSTLAPGKRKGP